MSEKDEMKKSMDRLMQRNIEISEMLEKIRSKKLTEDSAAKDKALQEEFDANQRIISELMMGAFRNEDVG